MGIFSTLRRLFGRRTYLKRADRKSVEALAGAPLAEAAPEVAEAIHALRKDLAATAYDAVEAAHESLAPEVKRSLDTAKQEVEAAHRAQLDKTASIATECRDELATTQRSLADQVEQLTALRELYSEQQKLTERLQGALDGRLHREFVNRFIRILDSLEEQTATLEEGSEHRADLHDVALEIQFALEAGGIEQFRPEDGSPFAGREKALKVLATVPCEASENAGAVVRTVRPGYHIVPEDANEPTRVLRPAHVEIYADLSRTSRQNTTPEEIHA